MRLMRFCRWIGHSGTSAVIAEQFGLAMMPLCSRMRRALISGMTSGTSGSMRKADELSTTTAPAFTAIGAYFREMLPPAENSAMSTPSKECSVSSSITTLLAAEFDGLAGRAGAGQRLQPADAEIALVHGGDEFGADGAGDADNGHDWDRCSRWSSFGFESAGNKKAPVLFRRGFGELMRSLTTRARLPSPRRVLWFWRWFGGRVHGADLCGRVSPPSTAFGRKIAPNASNGLLNRAGFPAISRPMSRSQPF